MSHCEECLKKLKDKARFAQVFADETNYKTYHWACFPKQRNTRHLAVFRTPTLTKWDDMTDKQRKSAKMIATKVTNGTMRRGRMTGMGGSSIYG